MKLLPRDWTLFGRPLGEWLFLAALSYGGINLLQNVGAASVHGLDQWSVLAAQAIAGAAALGIVVATLAGRRFGIPLLWLFAAAASFAAPMAAATFGGAPAIDVVLALLGGVALGAAVAWYGRRRLHAAITRRLWPVLRAEHAVAADEFVSVIRGLSIARWTARSAPDGWSPAEITDHLARTYAQYAGESRGKNSLRIRLGPLRLLVVRLFVKPRLLAGAPFPKARAPRVLLPSTGPDTPADGVALFRATGDGCLRDLEVLVERRPYKRLMHPFLGALPLYEVVRFAVHHVHHHRRQLLAVLSQLSYPEHSNDLAP